MSMTRASLMLMLGQYFKKRREIVEIVVVSSTGASIIVMSWFLNFSVR